MVAPFRGVVIMVPYEGYDVSEILTKSGVPAW